MLSAEQGISNVMVVSVMSGAPSSWRVFARIIGDAHSDTLGDGEHRYRSDESNRKYMRKKPASVAYAGGICARPQNLRPVSVHGNRS